MFYVIAWCTGKESRNIYNLGAEPMRLSKALTLVVLALVMSMPVYSQPASTFFPGGTYNEGVHPPDSSLGFPLGQRPARYAEVVRTIRLLAEQSSRVVLVESGATHEGRKLYYLLISSEENLRRIDAIRETIARLADPSSTAPDRDVLARTPAVVWMGYGIHGDELSSVDAALQVAYQLGAGTDRATQDLLDQLVICIDPVQNPDGRERFLSQMEQWRGAVPSSDRQSMQHTGMWPYGRGNHYLFDLNRDWFMLVHPESRARVRAIADWNPQVVVDSHEMGAYDTYLFSPPREPINTNIGENVRKWGKVFAAEQASAFDNYGWSYYTREWSDHWYPGYGSAWGEFLGAVGILYEQAGVDGSLVKKPDGTIMRYPETVHHHFVSSLANLKTAASHRTDLLRDFSFSKRLLLENRTGFPVVFYLVPGKNLSRLRRLVEVLLGQGIDVSVTQQEMAVSDLHDVEGARHGSKRLPAGTYVVSLEQPAGLLAKAILEFDPRMITAFLQEERKSLEKHGRSKMYDVTAWSLPMAYDIEAYWSRTRPSGPISPVKSLTPLRGSVQGNDPAYGFLFDYQDDRSVAALSLFLEDGLKVRSAREPFSLEGRSYDRGAILLRRNENPDTLVKAVVRVAQSTGVTIDGVNSALSASGPDLGGNDFVLLEEPRIALVAGPEVSTTSFGALWHLLDRRLQMRHTILNTRYLGSADLRKYNVIILPSTWNPPGYKTLLGEEGIARIRKWIQAGGTLIGVGGAAAFLADTSTGLSATKLRRQVLSEVHTYASAVERELMAEGPAVDSVALWSGSVPQSDTAGRGSKQNLRDKELGEEDARMRLFMPRGAILRVDLDKEHWLAFGAGEVVPAIVYSSYAYLAKHPVQTPARFADRGTLRLSGLLWPEGRERWARSAYATRQRLGSGQVILFAGEPNFRGSFHGTERLLLNSILLGPGFGTRAPVAW
jgi:hypothetical protein